MSTMLKNTPEQNAAARAYILALKAGQKPSTRPDDVGTWTLLLTHLETVYDRSEGDTTVMTENLVSLMGTKQFSGLTELLTGETPDIEVTSDPAPMPPLPPALHYPFDFSSYGCPLLDQEYIPYSRRVSPESYEDFHLMGGLWVLSTVAARRIKIDFSAKEYTSLMLIQCAEPGLYKKSTTARPANEVLKKAGLHYLLGPKKITPQKLLTDMAGTVPKNYDDLSDDKKAWLTRRLAMAGQRGMYLDEFGLFLDAASNHNSPMADFIEFLLQVDSNDDLFDIATQARGYEAIDKPYLALLGSLTPSSIRNTAKQGSRFWQNGFWSRFCFITAPQDKGIDAPFGIGEIPVPYNLVNVLREWHQRLGIPAAEIVHNTNAKGEPSGPPLLNRDDLPETLINFGSGVHLAWITYRSALKSIMGTFRNSDLNGSYERLPIKAMRVAALFASLTNSPCIELYHWARAQEIAERWRLSLHELYRQVNTNTRETQHRQLEDEIMRNMERFCEIKKYGPSVADLKNRMARYSNKEIKEALDALVKAKIVSTDATAHTTRYVPLHDEPTPIERFQQMQGGL